MSQPHFAAPANVLASFAEHGALAMFNLPWRRPRTPWRPIGDLDFAYLNEGVSHVVLSNGKREVRAVFSGSLHPTFLIRGWDETFKPTRWRPDTTPQTDSLAA
jgi:hypothetical protein